jgi:hypothetical protein
MARRVRTAPAEFRDIAKFSPPTIRFVPLDETRVLLTVRPTDPVWTGAPPVCAPGAIVRIRPPADAADSDIARQRAAYERAGAVRIRVEPRAAGERVRANIVEDEPRPPRAIVREVVMAMAAEARTHNRTALIEELDRALTTQGA